MLYSPSPRGGLNQPAKAAAIDSRSAYNSVGAVVRWDVRRIIGAPEPIVINATAVMMPSNAKVSCVNMRHATRANTVDAETADVTNAQASHVASVKAAHTGTDVTAAKASKAATVSSAATATAPGLRARGKKAAGKHCACQNHRCSSFHDILHLIGRIVPPQDLVRHWRVQHSGRQRRDTMEMRTLNCFLN
jgi:hypothetical protein